jgi:hypothetical protein
MAETIIFTPRAELDAVENLHAFVNMCRTKLTVFGTDLPFDEISWDVTETVQLKGHGNKRVRIYFSTQGTVDDDVPTAMAEPFLSFAKSYVRYMQGMRPTKVIAFRVAALRALEVALTAVGEAPNPVKVDGGVLNRAAQSIADRFAEGTAYRIGSQLEILAAVMSENRLTAVPVRWRNSIKRPGDTTRVGKEFDERRAEKMPSAAALEALPKVFHLAIDPPDVVYSSIAAILCSAPDRINEVLLLPEDCEVPGSTFDGKEAYGLRWWPAKGAEPMVKWIIPSMAPVVAEAVSKIRRLTDDGRKVARWYEAYPDQIYLPAHLEYLRGKDLLSMPELGEVLWVDSDNRNTPRQWCKDCSVPLLKQNRRLVVRFADVEQAVLAMLPSGFPILHPETGLKYVGALAVIRRNELHLTKETFRCVIEPITINQVNSALGARIEHGFGSIFDRFGFTEDDGSPIRMNTHQFRHYLNTLAQAGGMSQLDIAKWSGRIDIRQNEAYDHVTADQMVAKIRDAIGDEAQMFGPLAALPKNIPISRDEFARLKIPTAHTTDFGFCVHDYTMTPCEQYADCINCNEHVCVKGNEHKAAMMRQRLEEALTLLIQAEKAKAEGYFGADRWMDHHKRTLERLTQLCEILDNPSVPVGSVVQLSSIPTVSRIQQAIEQRAELESSSSARRLDSSWALRSQ